MKNIIKEMYNGDLFPIGRLDCCDDEYREAMDDLIKAETELLNTSPHIKELFDKYQDAQIRLNGLNTCNEFLKGFKIGAQIMLEMTKPID